MKRILKISLVLLAVTAWALVMAVVPVRAQLVTSISDNELWLDGADMNNDGVFDTGGANAAITTWSDRSGNGIDVTATAGTPMQAFNVQNGLSTAQFGLGSTDKADNTTFNVASQYTILAVAKRDDNATTITNNQSVLSGTNNVGVDTWLYRQGTTYNFLADDSAGNFQTRVFASNSDKDSFHVFGVRVNDDPPSVSNDFKDLGFLDGASLSFDATNFAELDGIRIGNFDSGGNGTPDLGANRGAGGDIAEVVIYDKLLNTAERRVLENHFAAKWASASLGANDHYSFDTPVNGDNDFGVIGIGQEADGALTTSSDLGLTITEANGSLDNGEYVLAGTNDLSNSLVTTQLPTEIDERWERIWAIDETGDVDIILQFDFSDAGLTLPTGDLDFSLLQSLTEGGEFAPLVIPFTITDDQVSFTLPGADLEDGFFTLGISSAAAVPEPLSIALWLICGLGMVAFTVVLRRHNRSRNV